MSQYHVTLWNCPVSPEILIDNFRADWKNGEALIFHCDTNCNYLNNCPWKPAQEQKRDEELQSQEPAEDKHG